MVPGYVTSLSIHFNRIPNPMRYLPVILIFLFFPLLSTAQVDTTDTSQVVQTKESILSDTIRTDSAVVGKKSDTKHTKKKFSFRKMSKPKKAFILSMVLPGAGQLYNGQWYKVPVIYGGIVGLVYLLKDNKDKYERLREAYILSLKGETHEFPQFSSDALLFYRRKYFKKMELSYIGLGALYLLNGIDAFVSAHLLTFDVSDDLSLNVSPKIMTGGQQFAPGIGVRLALKGK